MFIIRSFLALAIVLVASTSTVAQHPLPDTNVVDLTILRDGNVVATPKLIMRVGSTAVLTVARADGYSIKGSLSPDARMINGRKVDLELYFPENGQWKLAAKPSIYSELNRSTRMMFPDASGRILEIIATVSDNFS